MHRINRMKGKLILLTVLLIGFAVFVFVKFYILDVQNAFGKIKITSFPVASVFVDNLAVGKTPFEQKFKVGEFMVKLIPEGTATDTASWQGKVKVYKNALSFINRELGSSDLTSAGEIFTVTRMKESVKVPNTGEIYVETEPLGALVYLDNDEKGVSSLELQDVPKGDHELSVYMPKFMRRTQKINVNTGFRVNAVFKLAIDQNAAALIPTETPKADNAASESAAVSTSKVVIGETPTGFLRVRAGPSVNASESARVNPGDQFDLLEEDKGWYKIEYEKGKQGWVYSQYASKK